MHGLCKEARSYMVSNVKSTWPSFVLRHTREGIPTGETWHASCCNSERLYPFPYIEFVYPLKLMDYATKWMCEECARKHGLIW